MQRISYFSNRNYSYNCEISSIITSLFSTEPVEENNYLLVGKYRKSEEYFSANGLIVDYKENLKRVPNYNNISEYEKILISSLLHSKKSHLILAGGMGSGKSSTITYLKSFFEKQYSYKVLYFNFNDGFNNFDSEVDSIDKFNNYFVNMLTNEIVDILNDDDNLEQITNEICINRKKYPNFVRFIQIAHRKQWKDKPHVDKVDMFYEKTLDNEKNYINLNNAFKILGIYKQLLKNKNKNIYIFFDNIDKLNPESQIKILNEIISHNQESKIKTLIAMRRCTYTRFNGRAALNNDYFHHHGHFPSTILLNKVRLAIDELSTSNKWELKEKHYTNLKRRLHYVEKLISQNKSFRKYINYLTGRSSRLALELIHKLFINDYIPYDEKPKFRSLLKDLFLEPFTLDLNQDENLVVNIFSDPNSGKFSILQVYIIYLFKDLKHKEINFKSIINFLFLITQGLYTKLEILDHINNLLIVDRPLIWMDSYIFIESVEKMENINEKLRRTEIGYGYYNLIFDIDYFQHCVESVKSWKHDYNPSHYQNDLKERIKFMYKCCQEILNEEQFFYNNYLKKEPDTDYIEFPDISTRFIHQYVDFTINQVRNMNTDNNTIINMCNDCLNLLNIKSETKINIKTHEYLTNEVTRLLKVNSMKHLQH